MTGATAGERIEQVLTEFDTARPVLDNCKHQLESLLVSLIASTDLSIHSITSRVKDRESLRRKVDKDEKYLCLGDIHDVLGVRIITYIEDDVDQIAPIIEAEFEVDFNNSVDKRAIMDPDRFGYASLHYVASHSTERLKLTEYKPYEGLKFEIQVRSILQHTWAEIEHDIGYKSQVAIPRHLRRGFSRLAGMLELADLEFARLKAQITEYVEVVRAESDLTASAVGLDEESLNVYYSTVSTIRDLDARIIDRHESLFADDSEASNEESVRLPRGSAIVQALAACGINTISQLDSVMQSRAEDVVSYSDIYTRERLRSTQHDALRVPPGASAAVLSWLLRTEQGAETGPPSLSEDLWVRVRDAWIEAAGRPK